MNRTVARQSRAAGRFNFPGEKPAHTEKPWPVIRNALVSLLDQSRPHTIYGLGEADVTAALAAIRGLEKELRIAVSLHALLLYCLAQAAREHPVARTYRRGRKLITFEDIDVLTPIDKRLPSGVRIPVGHIVRAAQSKSLAAINWELRQAVKAADLDHDPAVRMRRRFARLPAPVRRFLSRRVMRDPFLLKRIHGTTGITSIQSHGFDNPLLTLPPAIHTLSFSVGNLCERLGLAEDGTVVKRKVICLTGAADHDVMDGMQLTRFSYRYVNLIESAAGLDETFARETRRLLEAAREERALAATRA
jgi:pyruvate/2-oxoglutarate dehydrogenase complex dihydrolipoamide acyltransferase (E2) component